MNTAICGALTIGVVVLVAGCAGQGEPVPLALALKQTGDAAVASPGGFSVAVTPFGDDRSDRTKLGVHRSLWGATEPLTVKNGSVGEATAKAFAEYLARKGWRARYVANFDTTGTDDVVISGKVLESAVDAHGTVGSTDIAAKHKIVIHANNRSDGSSITQTVSHNGTYSVVWYSPQDAEELLNEVMERNFEKFVNQTVLEGSGIRFK